MSLTDEKIQEILRLKKDIAVLLLNVRDQKTVADKYAHENQYLQEYIESLMKKGDMK